MAEYDTSKSQPKRKGIVRRTIGGAYRFMGFKDIADGLGKQLENLGDTAARSKSLYQSYRDAIFKKRVARVESFEEAVARQKLSKKDLKTRRDELSISSFLFMAVFAGTAYFLTTAVIEDELLNAFTLLTICLTLGALIFSQRFRIWQIDQKRLGSPAEFIHSLFSRS